MTKPTPPRDFAPGPAERWAEAEKDRRQDRNKALAVFLVLLVVFLSFGWVLTGSIGGALALGGMLLTGIGAGVTGFITVMLWR